MGTTIDLNHVAWFVRVVESESFTRAAEGLGLRKSSLSRAVSRLEEDLGVRLLQRTTRRLSLTDAGRAYFAQARSALAGLADAAATVSDMGKEPRGVVRLTTPVDIGVILLTDVIARFVSDYPLIHIDLSLTSRVVDLVAEGFDLAVRAGRLEDSSLMARRVGSADLGLFAAPSYLSRKGTPASLAELANHDCVLFRGRDGHGEWKLSGPSGEESIHVKGPVSVDDLLLVQQAVEAGIGIGLLPLFVVGSCAKHREKSRLVRLLPDAALRGSALHVVSPSARHQPTRVALFRDFLCEALAALDGQAKPASTPVIRKVRAR
ncbi:MAG TPA: LysR family transcriptional regulator [Polyangiaceae bacterium]|nr:LysR family transcriptional regulator [Polyangiaceae bacterium]